MNISLTANNVRECSGGCKYCTACRSMDYIMNYGNKFAVDTLVAIDEKNFNDWKRDWSKVEETLLHHEQYLQEMKKPVDQRFAHFDIWGSDPVTNFLMTKEMTAFIKDFCDRNEIRCSISSSTNGLPLIRDDICQWHTDNKVTLQISHDGLGQWIRTGDVEPLDFDNTKKLFKNGTLNVVNDTLCYYNNDMMANMKFWTDYLMGLFPAVYSPTDVCTPDEEAIFRKLYIKLNHIYDGTPAIKAINKKGLYNGIVAPELIGKPIGNINFTGRALDDYIQSYYHIAALMLDPSKYNDPALMPFRQYIENQINRFEVMKSEEDIIGSCRSFQRYKHKIGDWEKQNHQTFVIDTLGQYSECNLIDGNATTANPGGVQPEYCKDCKYRLTHECNPCGSEQFTDHCEYRYRWAQFLESITWIKASMRNRGIEKCK